MVTFEGMHWFHLNFAELYITEKYRSSSILVIIHQILAVMALFRLVLLMCWYWFLINNFCRDALILLKVCRRIYCCKIQVKFDISNHPQNFGQVMAILRLSFCLYVDIGFHSITFAGIHWFYWKFAEGYIFCKIQVRFDIGNHLQIFGQVIALFWLSFCCWGKIQGRDIVSPQTFEGMHWFHSKFAEWCIIIA